LRPKLGDELMIRLLALRMHCEDLVRSGSDKQQKCKVYYLFSLKEGVRYS